MQPPVGPTKATLDPVIEVLRQGGSLTDAVVADIRGLLARGERDLASTVAASLRSDPANTELGHITTGIVAATAGHLAVAWSHLRDLPEPLWVRPLPLNGSAPVSTKSRSTPANNSPA